MWSPIRQAAYRIGRRIYADARGDVRNDPRTNGEYALLQRVIELFGTGSEAPVFVDVGANVGDWSSEVLRLAAARAVVPVVHAVEPSRETFERLSERFASSGSVTLHRLALTRFSGTAELRVEGSLSGTNSLSDRGNGRREMVAAETFDSFATRNAIRGVCMVKTDAEGFDLSVMQGAVTSLRERRVELWQFEYNHRWLDDRAYLRDVFDLAEPAGLSAGRVARGGHVELYEAWHPELERFFEANYCLVPRGGRAEALCTRFVFGPDNTPQPVTGRLEDGRFKPQ